MMVKLNVLYLLRLQNKRALGEMNRVRRGFWCCSSMFECNTKFLGSSSKSSTSLAPNSLLFLRERSSLRAQAFQPPLVHFFISKGTNVF